MAIIIRDILHKNHVAPLFSKTGVVAVILITIAFILPLFIVVQTHNYWVDTMTYFEQPNVRHLNEILVFLQTDNQVYAFASTKSLNDLVDGSSEVATALAPQFQILNHDSNSDGKAEQLEVKIIMNTNGAAIRNIAVLQTVVYSIHGKVQADIKTRFMNVFSTPRGVSRLSAQGSLDLVQKENFALGKIERQIGFSEENDLAYMLRRESIVSFMMQKFSLNTTAEYNVESEYITTVPKLSTGFSTSDSEEVEIDLLIDIPVNQQIRYRPSFLEKGSQFWTQYITLLIPSLYVIYEVILGGSFKRRILSSRVTSDIKQAGAGPGTNVRRHDF